MPPKRRYFQNTCHVNGNLFLMSPTKETLRIMEEEGSQNV